MMMRLAILLLFSPALLAGEPGQLYESIEDADIGRVFMTPEERQRLEARRGLVPSEGSDDAAAEIGAEQQPAPRPAAGIIISSSGRALVWREGGFERSDQSSVEDVRFPGRVRVQRYVSPPGGAPVDEDPTDEARDVANDD